MTFPAILLIFLNILVPCLCEKECDPSYCNHEGQCSIEANDKICNCIGKRYFQGTHCLDKVDNCYENPCKNGGECHSLVGQFICRNCNEEFGGLRCDVTLRNVFRNMVLFFNHYGYYSKTQKFVLLIEDLGTVPFSVEFVADNYVLDSFECNPKENESMWSYSANLPELLRYHGIRYYNDLPYEKGFYRLIDETFWDLELLTLTLSVYDAATAIELLYYQNFELLMQPWETMKCVPKLQFPHGSNPLEPLMLDIARYNNFKPSIVQRCHGESEMLFKWSVFDSIGSRKLHNFGVTQIPLLKIPPYRLWFNYHGTVMSSYSLVLTMTETWRNFRTITKRRCFILVLPKPVKATIKGGLQRACGFGQSLLLDGSESRDFAFAAANRQTLLYHWNCTSLEDPDNRVCANHLSTGDMLKINPHQLTINATYQFSLTVQSRVNIFVKDVAFQNITALEQPQLFIHIQCIRNCLRNQFVGGHSIHLKVECFSKRFCTSTSKLQWYIDDTPYGSYQRLIYMPKFDESNIRFTVKAWHKSLEGKCSLALAKNEPPAGGHCSIKPQVGVAFLTVFHVHCDDYQDDDSPLSYHYTVGNFPLERINDADVHLRLPECLKLVVAICDQFDACTESILSVTVSPLDQPEILKSITDLLAKGDRLSAMVLLKSLTSYVNHPANVVDVIASFENFNILTLIEIEQWLSISKDILRNLMPLDNRKSYAMLGIFKRLYHGLEFVHNDKEIQDLPLTSYERALHRLACVMGEYATPWELIPEINGRRQQQILASDPLAEDYEDLPEFDIHVVEKIANWLESFRVLQQCFDILSSHGSYVYFPSESTHIMEVGKFEIQINATEEIAQITFNVSDNSVELELSKDLHATCLQLVYLKSNPFWWYPSEHPLAMDVFSINFFDTHHASLTESLAFKSPLRQLGVASPVRATLFTLHSHLHMPVFFLQLPSNAAVIVTLLKADIDVHLEIFIGKRPRSFLVRESHRRSTIVAINSYNDPQPTYIAALASKEIKNFPFSFGLRVNIAECLHWDWNARDPYWSRKGCRPKIINNSWQKLECESLHLSTFSARNYEYQPCEELKAQLLLEALSFNWNLVIFYCTLLCIFCVFLFYNMRRSKLSERTLMTSVSDGQGDVQVFVYTGSHWNSGSTANIHLRFISERGPYSITIYQNPSDPQLVRNSLCKFLLSSNHIQMPVKLTLHHDQSGRYPSWLCQKIYVVNLQTHKSQVFVVNKWITTQPLQFVASTRTRLTFWEHLFNYYINWFQFQAVWGPDKYTDLGCAQRCQMWIAQTMVSLCIVACFYGPTTMVSYEEERDLYNSLNFTKTELLALPFICFLASLAIKFIFDFIFRIKINN